MKTPAHFNASILLVLPWLSSSGPGRPAQLRTPEPGGVLMAQLFGAAFIFGSIVLYLARNLTETDVAARAIMIGVVVSNTIGFIVTLIASLTGVWNAMGWLPVALYLVFGLGFAYILFFKRT